VQIGPRKLPTRMALLAQARNRLAGQTEVEHLGMNRRLLQPQEELELIHVIAAIRDTIAKKNDPLCTMNEIRRIGECRLHDCRQGSERDKKTKGGTGDHPLFR